MINTNLWVTLAAAILSLLLGLLVLARNPRKPLYLSFFIFSFITALWTFSVGSFSIFSSVFQLRLMYLFGALVLPAAIVWVDILDPASASFRRKIGFILLGIFTGVVSFLPNTAIRDIDLNTLEIIPGPFLNFYGIVLFSSAGYLIYLLVKGLRHSKGVQRLQYQYILVGGGGFILASVIVNLVIPVFYGSVLTYFDAQSSLFFVTFAAITIIKHRFMDVRMIAARSLAYSMLISIFVFVYAFAVLVVQRLLLSNVAEVSIFQWIIMVSLSVVMAVTFNPLRVWITRITDKIFFKNQYDTDQLLNSVSQIMSTSVELAEILERTIQTLGEEMKSARVLAVIFSEKRIIELRSIGYDGLKLELSDLKKIVENGIVTLDDLDDQPVIASLLNKYEAVVSVPLRTDSETVGLIMMGDKKSGDMFTTRDLKIFEIISSEIAINASLRLKVKKALYSLEVANKHLKELDKAKEEFMDIVAHNLRTPLTIIKGYLSFILEPAKLTDQKETLENVKKADLGVNNLSSFVEDIILATSILNKTKRFSKKEIEVRKLIREILNQHEQAISKKQLKVRVGVEDLHLWGDEEGVRKILENLIENAVKFNKENGEVDIRCRAENQQVVFSVSDTGIGIPQEKQRNLFNKFDRQTDVYNYQYEGVGLGLYLVRLLVGAHHGRLWFESKEGQGTKFFISFPQHLPPLSH